MSCRSSTFWLTGLSGAGKSTLSQAFAEHLRGADGTVRVAILDGDVVRGGLCADLGFTPEDRSENIRRVAEVAKILNDAGVTAIVALITPLQSDRAAARRILGEARFVEVFVDAPLSVCESRDPKGLYGKARSGALRAFTGVSAPYEAPTSPDVHLRTGESSLADCVVALETAWRARYAPVDTRS